VGATHFSQRPAQTVCPAFLRRASQAGPDRAAFTRRRAYRRFIAGVPVRPG